MMVDEDEIVDDGFQSNTFIRHQDVSKTTMHVTAHGEMGVRQFHAKDDSKILAHLRKGILELPDIDDR